jgi:hypothetical protein
MIIALFLLTADPAPAPTPAVPTVAEIKKVADYYVNGAAAGPILLDFVLCKKPGKTDAGKLTCEEPIVGGKAKKGDDLGAFTRWFAPKGASYSDMKVVFLVDGTKTDTHEFTLTESGLAGFGEYKVKTAKKPGTYEIDVMRGDKLLDSAKIVVE